MLRRLTTREYPDGGVEFFGYTPRGLVAYTNQLEYVTLFDYDEGGHMGGVRPGKWGLFRHNTVFPV